MEQAGRQASIHPELAAAITALSESGHWAIAYDNRWRIVAETPEQAAVLSESRIDDQFQWGPEALDVESPTDGTLDDPQREPCDRDRTAASAGLTSTACIVKKQ